MWKKRNYLIVHDKVLINNKVKKEEKENHSAKCWGGYH